MCANCRAAPSLNIARHGRTSVTLPSTSRKPVGMFIQALTETTQNVPNTPAAIIGARHHRCTRGGSRSQP
jgi:hypothetical protein